MIRHTCCGCVLLAISLTCAARGQEDQVTHRKLTAEYTKALSKLPKSFANVVEIHDAAKAFTGAHSDTDAVVFLKKAALEYGNTRDECRGQLAAFVGVALLSKRHDTAAFLKSHIDDKKGFLSELAFLAVSFLPIQDARTIAEGVVSDAEQNWKTRTQYLLLLRAVGNGDTLRKLEKMERTKGYELAVRDRTAAFLKAKLALKEQQEQERWARQELVFLQVRSWGPDFHFSGPALVVRRT